MFEILDKEERYILDAIQSARKVQDFLWGKHNQGWKLEEWKRMFRKRMAKIEQIDESNPHWKVEMRKRLLQTSALAIALIKILEDGKISLESNLPQYAKEKGGDLK